jgi:hypothetical protein
VRSCSLPRAPLSKIRSAKPEGLTDRASNKKPSCPVVTLVVEMFLTTKVTTEHEGKLIREALPGQLAEIVIAGRDAGDRVFRPVVLDDVVLDTSLLRVSEYLLPVDHAVAH